jgi:hypothetical protein
MKRYTLLLVVLTLALLATSCSPRAVLEDGTVVNVQQFVFDDVMITVARGSLQARIGETDVNIDQITSVFNLPNLAEFVDPIADWMAWARVDNVTVYYLGNGIAIELDGNPFPSLTFPDDALANAAQFGLDVATQGGVTIDPALHDLIETALIPVGAGIAQSFRLNLVFDFPR